MKITYNCTQNIKTVINSHNAKILFPKKCTEQRTCNCLNKDNFPLEQNVSLQISFTKLKSHQAMEIIKKKFISAHMKPPLKNDFEITKSHLI